MIAKQLCAFLILGLIQSTSAHEIVLQNDLNGYRGNSTTILIAGSAGKENSYGGLPSILIGAGASVERRALLHFDLTHLAGKKVTTDVRLELHQSDVRGSEEVSFEIAIHEITPQNGGWKAGESKGSPSEDHEANWTRHSAGNEGRPWAGAPGLSMAGVDYVPHPLAVLHYEAPNPSNTVFVTLPKDTVQRWIDDASTNAGLLLRKSAPLSGRKDALAGFISGEHRTKDYRPKLIVPVEH